MQLHIPASTAMQPISDVADWLHAVCCSLDWRLGQTLKYCCYLARHSCVVLRLEPN